MAAQPLYPLNALKSTGYDWSIIVRVIRKWRNSTKEDKLVNGFNILILDDNNVTMQAFVGESCFLKFIDVLVVGKVFIISNFTVKPVSERDRNLLTHNDRQIFFTTYTTVEDVDDIPSLIPGNHFDFYDIGELEGRQKQDIYLTDVIGIMEDYHPIRRWTSKRDNSTRKAIVKFGLTDGSSSVQVSLWDEFAERFNSALTNDMEEPFIVIVAAARIIIAREVLEVATCRPTLIFVNYNYPTVHQLRKIVRSTPNLTQTRGGPKRVYNYVSSTVAQVLALGKESVGKKVVAMVTIQNIVPQTSWFFYECTSCFEELTPVDNSFYRAICCRCVEYPDRKFQVLTLCADDTGSFALVLTDREVRRLTMETVGSVLGDNEIVAVDSAFPKAITDLKEMQISVLIEMTKENTAEGCNLFTPTEITAGHSDTEYTIPMEMYQATVSGASSDPFTQGTSSTSDYHLDSISQLQLHTPTTSTSSCEMKNKQKWSDLTQD